MELNNVYKFEDWIDYKLLRYEEQKIFKILFRILTDIYPDPVTLTNAEILKFINYALKEHQLNYILKKLHDNKWIYKRPVSYFDDLGRTKSYRNIWLSDRLKKTLKDKT